MQEYQKEAMPIDRRIATEVMGWEWVRLCDMSVERFWVGRERPGGSHTARVPRYSEEIGAAWQLVEHLQHAGYDVMIDAERGPDCAVSIDLISSDGSVFYRVRNKSAAVAICEMALQWAEQRKEASSG